MRFVCDCDEFVKIIKHVKKEKKDVTQQSKNIKENWVKSCFSIFIQKLFSSANEMNKNQLEQNNYSKWGVGKRTTMSHGGEREREKMVQGWTNKVNHVTIGW